MTGAESSLSATATTRPSPVARLTAAANAVGAFPFDAGSHDAALLITLLAGAGYTIPAIEKNGTTGTVPSNLIWRHDFSAGTTREKLTDSSSSVHHSLTFSG